MTRPTFADFKVKALAKPAVKAEYEALELAYKLRLELITLRKAAGLTQADLAERLHTQKSNISRLENVNSSISPKLSTIEDYAKAIGYKVKISLVPDGLSSLSDKSVAP